jgi:hypothetical protein
MMTADVADEFDAHGSSLSWDGVIQASTWQGVGLWEQK